MVNNEILVNILLMLLCYVYVVFIIFVTSKMDKILQISQKTARKFLHAMIGNLPFIIPFFTSKIYPVLVAAPFILVTFLASPYSPSKLISRRLKSLSELTEKGHHLGLVFYAISYTILAFLFSSKPYVMAAGILPMAYGDSTAALVGERYGRRRYKLVADKSLEGSTGMFCASFLSLIISLIFFSVIYSFSVIDTLIPAFATVTVVTLVESLSPRGVDNLTVPISGTLTFLLLAGGL